MYLFFDTETTGLPNFKLPFDDESQPHICQLGAILTDGDGKIKAELNVIIKPDGWTITKETSGIHGITQEDAVNYGIGIERVLPIFMELTESCETIIAHNISFDRRMIERVAPDGKSFFHKELKWFCTMEKSKEIVKAPLTEKQAACGFTGYKSPNLQEAYTFFHGIPFEGAHDAMADVRACRDVFFKLKGLPKE